MAEILADHLHATVGKVIGIAKEIDDEYATRGRRRCIGRMKCTTLPQTLLPISNQADAQRPGRQSG